MTATQWAGCYRNGWTKGDVVPATFQHPAKYSKSLIFRIIEHLLATGYVTKGDTILDPFGGVALGALPAMSHGCSWIGCELEPSFVTIGHENLALWRRRFGFGTGALLQGDSRQLRNVLQAAGNGTVAGVVTSPPFMDERAVSGRKYQELDCNRQGYASDITNHYGVTPGNLGNMKPGAVVASPPFLSARSGTTASGETHGGGPCAERIHTVADGDRLGQTPGNLAAMPIGDAVVTNPPFEGCLAGSSSAYAPHDTQKTLQAQYKENPVGATYQDVATRKRLPDGTWPRQRDEAFYTNLGINHGETFWSAAHQILQECFQVLRPGAVAAFVVKDYVRDKAIVPFCAQWQQCCETVGFVPREEIHALLVEDHGTQTGLFGTATTVTTARKSFFRRLAEANGSPRIDYETVLILQKPL